MTAITRCIEEGKIILENHGLSYGINETIRLHKYCFVFSNAGQDWEVGILERMED